MVRGCENKMMNKNIRYTHVVPEGRRVGAPGAWILHDLYGTRSLARLLVISLVISFARSLSLSLSLALAPLSLSRAHTRAPHSSRALSC